MKRSPVLIVGVLIAAAGLAATQQTSQQQGPVTWIELPLKFPAVGNIDAVRQWRFGRLQEAEQTAGTDIRLGIRIADGSVLRIVGPGPQLAQLAWQSNWVRTATKSFPGRRDFAERMIAFDVDESGRLIAMASLETVNRDPNRLRRAIGF